MTGCHCSLCLPQCTFQKIANYSRDGEGRGQGHSSHAALLNESLEPPPVHDLYGTVLLYRFGGNCPRFRTQRRACRVLRGTNVTVTELYVSTILGGTIPDLWHGGGSAVFHVEQVLPSTQYKTQLTLTTYSKQPARPGTSPLFLTSGSPRINRGSVTYDMFHQA